MSIKTLFPEKSIYSPPHPTGGLMPGHNLTRVPFCPLYSVAVCNRVIMHTDLILSQNKTRDWLTVFP
jgi:hypothetical protein